VADYCYATRALAKPVGLNNDVSMKAFPLFIFLSLVLALTSCQSPRSTSSAVVLEIPRYNDDPFLAEAAPAAERIAGETMRVFVRGEVMSPGAILLPAGATVLEAIKATGGFSHFASPKRIRIYRQGRANILWLQEQKRPFQRSLIWYSPSQNGESNSKSPPGDYVLEPNTSIEIDRAIH
jgi:hypothetical protein